jgi:multidrug efflux pump subunit AcrA (membrane-fusion protein)
MKLTRPQKSLVFLAALGMALFATAAWQGNLLTSKCMPPSVPAPPTNGVARVRAEGRVVCYPGSQVEVGSEIAGLIVNLPIEEN